MPKRQQQTKSRRTSRPITSSTDDAPPLLYDRQETSRLLGGVCRMTLFRMERDGRLTPIKLTKSKQAHVFYRAAEVMALAGIVASGLGGPDA
jgi:hypothetical protein